MITIDFVNNINNDSLQVGDLAFFITHSNVGGFDTSITAEEYNPPKLIGPIQAMTPNSITVDETVGNPTPLPTNNDFIMFAKDSRINLSGLIGYYAEVEIKNNSEEKAEMYCIASEITPSSE